jgi:endonuclease G
MLRQFTVPVPHRFAHAVVLATAILILTLTGCTHRTTVQPVHTVPNRALDAAHRPTLQHPRTDLVDRIEHLPPILQTTATTPDQVHPSHCPFGSPKPRKHEAFGPTEAIWRPGYDLLHSAELKIPYWVCETYTQSTLVQNVTRGSRKFTADPDLHGPHAVPSDYQGSASEHLDIGHMAPAGAHEDNQRDLQDTFYLSNAAPQNAALNRGLWEKIEQCARTTTPAQGTTWVITGPMFATDRPVPDIPVSTIGAGVVIPTHIWKVVIAEQADGVTRIWAVVTPNQKPPEGWALDDFAVSIATIENETGFDLMPTLPIDQRQVAEQTGHTIGCH